MTNVTPVARVHDAERLLMIHKNPAWDFARKWDTTMHRIWTERSRVLFATWIRGCRLGANVPETAKACYDSMTRTDDRVRRFVYAMMGIMTTHSVEVGNFALFLETFTGAVVSPFRGDEPEIVSSAEIVLSAYVDEGGIFDIESASEIVADDAAEFTPTVDDWKSFVAAYTAAGEDTPPEEIFRAFRHDRLHDFQQSDGARDVVCAVKRMVAESAAIVRLDRVRLNARNLEKHRGTAALTTLVALFYARCLDPRDPRGLRDPPAGDPVCHAIFEDFRPLLLALNTPGASTHTPSWTIGAGVQ